ncbi:Uncharacterised protein [Klebsiella pneumoniae]|nr:Uncharacterised protein [Klebsiella pneumoniae]
MRVTTQITGTGIQNLLEHFGRVLFRRVRIATSLALSCLAATISIRLALVALSFRIRFPVSIVLLLVFTLLITTIGIRPLVLIVTTSALTVLRLVATSILLVVTILTIQGLLLFFLLFLLDHLDDLVGQGCHLCG